MANDDATKGDAAADSPEGRRGSKHNDQMLVLEQLADSLQTEDLEAAHKSNGLAGRDRHAARRKIGLSAPSEPTGFVRMGATPPKATASLAKALAAIDGRIVDILSASATPPERDEAQMEVALLLHIRRSLSYQTAQVPNDVVLCDTLVDYAEQALAVVADLQQGGMERLHRIVAFMRHSLSELAMIRAPETKALKQRVQQLRDSLGDASPNQASLIKSSIPLFKEIMKALDRAFPRAQRSILDDVLH